MKNPKEMNPNTRSVIKDKPVTVQPGLCKWCHKPIEDEENAFCSSPDDACWKAWCKYGPRPVPVPPNETEDKEIYEDLEEIARKPVS